jgi:hypothetical protein
MIGIEKIAGGEVEYQIPVNGLLAEQKELDEAVNAGCEVITLGKRILRTETAGMMLLSVLMYNMEE